MITALILGFAGSLHCVGMCGPIVLALPHTSQNTKMHFYFRSLLYNIGRATTYLVLGLTFGALGQIISLAGFQAALSISLGLIILISLFLPLSQSLSLLTSSSLWRNTLGKLFKKKSLSAFLGIGLLNGLLPCGLVYTALAGAIASGDSWYAGQFMLVFGLGTIPVLIGVSVFGNATRINLKGLIKRALPVMIISLGILLILRGLSLGIPYISPDLFGKTNDLFIPYCH